MEIDIKPNDTIHSYRFEHPIGHGAYGMVWKVHHLYLDRPFAAKVIDTRNLDAQDLERVKQECRIGGKLEHKDHVVQVQDAFPEGDYFYIVMELMTGGSLERYLRDHPHPGFGLTLAWALDLCAALEQVHALDVVHRDIKPQNILLADDAQIKLSDFGVSHLPDSGLTTVFQPGTPGYRAPEQEANQPVDAGADVYALCAVLFEVWTGQKHVRYKHADREVVREEMSLFLAEGYPDLAPALSDRLVNLVLSGLRSRQERISLAELKASLDAIQRDWLQGETGEQAISVAQAQVAQQLKSIAHPTVVSNLPQRPVAARSKPAGQTVLTEWLEDQFGLWYKASASNNVILWFDPEGEWQPLLDGLSPNLNLLRYRGSLLETRYRLEQRPLDQLTVVYLPMKQEEADYLLPYRFTSRIFCETLYDFLTERGAPLPQGARERREIKAMLPLLARESVGKGASFWESVTSVKGAWAALIPDFAGQMGQFLDQPQETWKSLQQGGRAAYFGAMIEAQFGFAAPADDPEGYARALVTHMCLVDLYWQAGAPDDFSYPLPDARFLDACRSALTTWRYDSRYRDRFAQYARSIEADYAGLLDWARAHADRLQDPPLPGVARAAWERVASEIAGWTTLDDARAYAGQQRGRIRQAAKSFWSTLGETPGWAALALADELMCAVGGALDELGGFDAPAGMIRAYVERWWQVDRTYRHCKRALEGSFSGSAALAGWVDRFYMRFLTETNQRWTLLLSSQNAWGFPGVLPSQDAFWQRAAGSTASRRAVFLVDALRYELGHVLLDRLSAEYDAGIEAMATSLPSNTSLGMSALLPGAEKREIGWQDKDWRISVPGFEGNLAGKADRDKWLQACLPSVEIVTLQQLLSPAATIGNDVKWLIVTSGEIDAIGENARTLTPTVLDDLVERVARGVRRAAQAGFGEIHVVGDHGFLLFDRVADHGKVELAQGEWLKKGPRYAISRQAEAVGHLRFPIPGSKELVGCFPHGIVCFKAWGQYNYVHGGPALQEVIVPHLTVRSSPLSLPVGVEIEADTETRVAFFKVTLRPVPRGLLSMEREVRLALERQGGDLIRDSVEVVGLKEPVVKNLKVYPQDNVPYGETLHITAYDAQTGERLARHAIRFVVSLDL
jgi:serine/threonine protein kinase